LFNPPGGATPEALAALEAAIANYQAILAKVTNYSDIFINSILLITNTHFFSFLSFFFNTREELGKSE